MMHKWIELIFYKIKYNQDNSFTVIFVGNKQQKNHIFSSFHKIGSSLRHLRDKEMKLSLDDWW